MCRCIEGAGDGEGRERWAIMECELGERGKGSRRRTGGGRTNGRLKILERGGRRVIEKIIVKVDPGIHACFSLGGETQQPIVYWYTFRVRTVRSAQSHG